MTVNDEVGRLWRKRPWTILIKYPCVCPWKLRKATKYLNQDSRSPGLQSISRLPEDELGVQVTRQRLSVP
jgi:hypothetical protein